MTPTAFSAASPLTKVGGVIRAPVEDTYVGSEGSSLIDFFVISGVLDNITGTVTTDLSGPYSPHRPVCVSVKQECQDIQVHVPVTGYIHASGKKV